MTITLTTQKQELEKMFTSRPGQWITLPEILRLGIAQYNARILDLRRSGMNIQNRTYKIGGTRCSEYKYTSEQLAHQLGVSVGTIKNMLKRYSIRKKGKGNRLPKSILKLT